MVGIHRPRFRETHCKCFIVPYFCHLLFCAKIDNLLILLLETANLDERNRESFSSSINHLLCFLLHRGRSSLAHSSRVVSEVRAFDGERGAIVTGCPDAKAETCPGRALLSHPFVLHKPNYLRGDRHSYVLFNKTLHSRTNLR